MAVVTPVKYYNTFVLKKIIQGDISAAYNWYVEESRIKGGYNNTQTGLAPRAFLRSEDNKQESLGNSIIYSGVLNSRTGLNQTNQFPSGQDITRSVDPSKGSIQKLYAEDTNLIIFQENKVNRALIDKDAIFTQEGQAMQTTSNVVIGAIVPYAGEFGISKNPESFAVYGYRKYFTDANQGAVLRLSQDGITEISAYGMYDYFRDRFSALQGGKAIGGWDIHNKCYTLSLESLSLNISTETLSFDEQVQGWTSRYSYSPTHLKSVQNNFYSTNAGGIYIHYSTLVNNATFYGTTYDSTITTVFNKQPSLVKSFKTINYEGGANWALKSIFTDSGDSANFVDPYVMPTTLADLENQLFKNQFKKKEDKYFADLINTTAFTQGEVVFGASVSGIKGYTAQALFTAKNTSDSGANELFATSTEYKESSY
tara:strand:+ start:5299 stop:6576 length:1278 start_codon:yes stop_codon:yes gene_type:complete